jgi:phosphohistidine phosphatase
MPRPPAHRPDPRDASILRPERGARTLDRHGQGLAGCQTRPVEPHRLVLVRHAQAGPGPFDAERPLTERGARHAAAIGARLEQAASVPDRVLVSPARRARETWELAGSSLLGGPEPVVDERVYDNTVEALLAAVQETADDVRTLAVVGHNPSIGELAGVLDDGRGNPSARGRLVAGYPAGGVAVFTLSASFAAIAPGTATLDDVLLPAD